MKEQKDKNLRMFNEMDDRTRKMNVQSISAFEAADGKTGTHAMPGFEKNMFLEKEDFKRYPSQNKVNYKPGEQKVPRLPSVGKILDVDVHRARNGLTGRLSLDNTMPSRKAMSFKKLPTFTQRSSKARASFNYEDLAGLPHNWREQFDIISNHPPAKGLLTHRHSISELPTMNTLKDMQEKRTNVESPWKNDTLEWLHPRANQTKLKTPPKDPAKQSVAFE